MSSHVKKLGLLATLVASSFLVAPAAHAQGPSANNWTGLYLGAHAGVQNSDVDVTNASGVHFYIPGDEYSFNTSSMAGGLQLEGWYQFNHFAIGGELAATAGEFDDQLSAPGPFTDNVYTTDISEIYTASVKLGYAPSGCSCILYGRVGYAQADISTAASEEPTFPHFGGSEEQHDGLALGLGYAQRVGGHLVVGFDYTHIDFDDQTHVGFDNTAFDTYSVNVEAQVDLITARLAWQLF